MKEEKINLKSDVDAKQAFSKLLAERGYSDIKIVSAPADISALKEGAKYYFEIKFTRKKATYFGAATLTEWSTAIRNPDKFKFVIAQKEGDLWKFKEYTPKEFMEHNTIPPFKTYFNISLGESTDKKRKSRTSVQLTEERLKEMEKFWNSLKE